VTIVDALKLVVGRDSATLRAHLSEHLGKQRGFVYARQREPWRRREMRHWNPEAHIGDDRYVLPDVKAAVAEATAGTTDEQEMRRVERI